MSKFPNDWPQPCPPSDAMKADGEYFRIVRNDPPNASDFKSHHEAKPLPKEKCNRCSLSTFRTLEGAIHMRLACPEIGDKIAIGTLDESHGSSKVTNTSTTHAEWWPLEGVDRHAPFKVTKS